MIGFFKRIFGKPSYEEQLKAEIAKVYDPTKDTDRLGLALLMTLRPQLELLGLDTGIVPTEGAYVSETSRGYLFGLAQGLLIAEGVDPTPDNKVDALLGSFGLVYGDPIGRDWAVLTDQEMMAGNATVIEASEWAVKEVEGIYKSGGVTSAMGFYLSVNGLL